VLPVSNKQKKLIFFVGILKLTEEKRRHRSGSVIQSYGSADPNENVTDAEHFRSYYDNTAERGEAELSPYF
jgi:hypothetical protein